MSLFTDVEKIIEDHNAGDDFLHREADYMGDDDGVKAALTAAGISYENVDHHGGEGEGDNYYSVYSFDRNGEKALIQFQGWYASYVGSEYENMFEVIPEEKTVTVYRAV